MSWESKFEKEYKEQGGGETYDQSYHNYSCLYVDYLERRLDEILNKLKEIK